MSENQEVLKEDEVFQGIAIDRQNFKLLKVKVNKDNSLLVKFIASTNSDDGVISRKMTVEPNYQAAQPLLEEINKLKEVLCKVCYKKPDAYQFVKVVAVEMSGNLEVEKFKIFGTEKSASEQNSNFTTHKINFDDETYSDEGVVIEILENIENYVYSYTCEEEKAEITMGLAKAPAEDKKEEENTKDQGLFKENEDAETPAAEESQEEWESSFDQGEQKSDQEPEEQTGE